MYPWEGEEVHSGIPLQQPQGISGYMAQLQIPQAAEPDCMALCRMARMHNIIRYQGCLLRDQSQEGLSVIVICEWAAGLAASCVRCTPATLPAQRTLSTFSQAAGTLIRYFCLEFTKSVVPLLAAPTDVDVVDSAPL